MKITLENLSLQYGGVRVVKELDLEIGDGESLVLLGQSGCGKTSTMRCIAGLEQPSGGRITIGDTVVHDSSADSALRRTSATSAWSSSPTPSGRTEPSPRTSAFR